MTDTRTLDGPASNTPGPPPQCAATILRHNKPQRCGFDAGHDGSHRVEGGGVRWVDECPHCGKVI